MEVTRESREEPRRGHRIGHYRLTEFLGALGLREASDVGEALQQIYTTTKDGASPWEHLFIHPPRLSSEEMQLQVLPPPGSIDAALRAPGRSLLSVLSYAQRKYILDRKFEAGSHGEIWRAHRAPPCDEAPDELEDEGIPSTADAAAAPGCDEGVAPTNPGASSPSREGASSHTDAQKAPPKPSSGVSGPNLVIKRIYGSRGPQVLLAGLREALHGPKFAMERKVNTLLDFIIREREYSEQAWHGGEDAASAPASKYLFGDLALRRARELREAAESALATGPCDTPLDFIERHELWLVFEDAGVSLKSLLYDALPISDANDATRGLGSSPGATLLTPSKFWFRMRAEETAPRAAPVPSCPPDSTLRRILRQLLEAVAAVHEAGMAHRDIKPSNIVIQFPQSPGKSPGKSAGKTSARGPSASASAPASAASRGIRPPPPPKKHLSANSLFRSGEDKALMVPPPSSVAPVAPEAQFPPPPPLHLNLTLVDFSSAADEDALRGGYFAGLRLDDCTLEYLSPEFRLGPEAASFSQTETARPSSDDWQSSDAWNSAASVAKWQRADLWAVGVVWLELLLGSRETFRLDQRTTTVLLHSLQRGSRGGGGGGGADHGIEAEVAREEVLYLASLAEFCLYTPPAGPLHTSWPRCDARQFAEAVRRRDELDVGLGGNAFAADLLFSLLAFDPQRRMPAHEALEHAYFVGGYPSRVDGSLHATRVARDRYDGGRGWEAIEDPDQATTSSGAARTDREDPKPLPSPLALHGFSVLGLSHPVPASYTCTTCGRTFHDWRSCHEHAKSRRHGNPHDGHGGALGFCDHGTAPAPLPSCEGTRGLTALLRHDPASGWCEMRGRRPYSEDFTAASFGPQQRFFGVFDGHWGTWAARHTSQALFVNLELALELRDRMNLSVADAMSWAFRRTQSDLAGNFSSAGDRSGATATAVVVRPEEIIAANIGDSRATLCCDGAGKTVQLTVDHTPAEPDERARIEATPKGFVRREGGILRVQGKLAVTRAFGDGAFREYGLTSEPFVSHWPRSPRANVVMLDGTAESSRSEEFLVVASDGLWDVLENEEATGLVRIALAEHPSGSDRFQHAAERLAMEAYVRGSTDNIGVCVIDLR